MAGMPGDPHSPRLFAPGVAVLLGYVLLIGNPWVNRDIDLVLSDSDSILRLIDVMVFYPSWQLDVDRVGPFLFWSSNLRTVLFVGVAMVGLSRVSRWVREASGGAGVFIATVGVVALSALAAGLTAAAVAQTLLDAPLPFGSGDGMVEYFLSQLSASASFGVLFGLVLGAVVVAQRHSPSAVAHRVERAVTRRANAPKSFW